MKIARKNLKVLIESFLLKENNDDLIRKFTEEYHERLGEGDYFTSQTPDPDPENFLSHIKALNRGNNQFIEAKFGSIKNFENAYDEYLDDFENRLRDIVNETGADFNEIYEKAKDSDDLIAVFGGITDSEVGASLKMANFDIENTEAGKSVMNSHGKKEKKKPVTKSRSGNQKADYVCTAKGTIYDEDGIADYSLDADVLRVRSKSGKEIEFAPSDLPVDFEEISIYEILPSGDAIMSGLKAEYIDGSKPDFEIPLV